MQSFEEPKPAARGEAFTLASVHGKQFTTVFAIDLGAAIWPQMVYELMDPRQEANSILDSTIIRAHQDSYGGTGGVKKSGRQVGGGGVSTKIHAVVDSRGNPQGAASGGNRFDSLYRDLLLSRCHGRAVIADRAYGSTAFREAILALAKKPVILCRSNAVASKRIDRTLYSNRILAERFSTDSRQFAG